jgi:hypothetical protein
MINNRKIDFNDETIQKLFGYEDAESEPIERLKEYYLKSDTFNRATSDLPIRILVGHKGIGKSALFKVSISEEQVKENLTVSVKPDDIAELGKNDENFLLKVRQWKLGLIRIIGNKLFQEFGINDEKTLNRLNLVGIKLISFLSESIDALKNELSLLPMQQKLIDNFFKTKKVIVYIDDLDRGWEGKRDDINRISALLNSVRDLANESPGLCFRISLRSDVYFLVRTSDESTDKIEGSVVWYSWTNHEIFVMLLKRVMTFLEEPINEDVLLNTPQNSLFYHLDSIMENRFHGRGQWANVPMYKVLMSLIRKRPRDLVKLCTLAAREAKKNNSSKISTKDLEAIFEEYSQGRIQDTINEYRSELSTIDKLIFGMKPTTKEIREGDPCVFTTQNLHKKIGYLGEQNRFFFANQSKASDKELAHFLYKINFLTARKKLEDGQLVRKYFEENRYLSSLIGDFGYDWEIHPAYRWALQPDNMDSIFNKLYLSAD